MDMYLMEIYTKSENPRAIYLYTDLMQREAIGQNDIDAVQQLYPAGHRTKPVVFLRLYHSHYFAVSFDYVKGHCGVYGRRIGKGAEKITTDRWEDWKGPQLWRKGAVLLGIPTPAPPKRISASNFEQVRLYKIIAHTIGLFLQH